MIPVRATRPGYFGHRRREVGEVFDIQKMEQFSKNWMVKVDEGAKSEVKEPEGGRIQAALSDGASKVLHTGKVDDPKKLGKTDVPPPPQQPTPPVEEKGPQTTGNEDVI